MRKTETTNQTPLKKQIAELEKENAELKLKLEQAEMFASSTTKQKQDLEQQLTNMVKEYTRITGYILSSLDVFHKSIYMACREGGNK